MPVSIDSSLYNQYIGHYLCAPGHIIEITKESNKLFNRDIFQRGNEIEQTTNVQLFPKSENEFFMKFSEIEYSFIKNEENKVVELVIHRDEKNQSHAKKIK